MFSIKVRPRVTRNLRHWAMEFVILVTGVMLALWAQQWADQRKDDRERRDLLERLATEAEDIVAVVREQRDAFQKMSDSQVAALDRWVNTSTCPTAADWNAFGLTGMYPALSYPTAAYDEMIGSGGLSKLPSVELRRKVSAFHAEARRYERQQDFFRQASIVAAAETTADSSSRATVNTESKSIGFDNDTDRACRDRETQFNEAMQVRNFRVMQRYRVAVAEKAIQMCAAIAREIGKQCVPSEGGPLSAQDQAIAAGKGAKRRRR